MGNDDARKEYAERDHMALCGYYVRHVAAMTAEGLHAKSDIAAELAWRDREIDNAITERDSLAAECERLWKDAARYRWLNSQNAFLMHYEDAIWEKHRVNLRCGVPLDEWIDAAIDKARTAR